MAKVQRCVLFKTEDGKVWETAELAAAWLADEAAVQQVLGFSTPEIAAWFAENLEAIQEVLTERSLCFEETLKTIEAELD
jgi:hypothetical protein